MQPPFLLSRLEGEAFYYVFLLKAETEVFFFFCELPTEFHQRGKTGPEYLYDFFSCES